MSFYGEARFDCPSNENITCYFKSQEEKEEFARWAFGHKAHTIDMKDVPYLWNIKHPDLFYVQSTNQVYRSLGKMVQAWRERNSQ